MIILALISSHGSSYKFVIDRARVKDMSLRIAQETHKKINRPEGWVCLQRNLTDWEWNVDSSATLETFYL